MTSATVNPDCGTPPSPAPRRIAQLEFRQDAARGVFVDDDLSAAMGAGDTVALLRLADPDKRHLSTALAGERQLLEKHLMHLRHYRKVLPWPGSERAAAAHYSAGSCNGSMTPRWGGCPSPVLVSGCSG